MLNGACFNGPIFNGPARTAPVLRVVSFAQRFHVKVYNADNEFLAYVDKYSAESALEETANQPETLTLQLSPQHEAALAGVFVRPNVVRLYDASWNWLRTFAVVRTLYTRKAGERLLTVECRGLMSIVEKRTIALYVSETPATIQTHLTAWFAGTGIAVGYVSPGIAETPIAVGTLKNTPVLQAIDKLRQAVGGFYSIDKAQNFNWYQTQPQHAQHLLSLSSNIVSFEENVDGLSLANTIEVIGGINPATKTRIVATAVNAASVSLYGEQKLTINNRAITSQAMAQGIADRRAAQLGGGKVERKIGAIDLSQVPNTFEGLAADPRVLRAGLTIKAVPPPDATVPALFTTTVLRVRRTLGNPAAAVIEVGDEPKRTFADLIFKQEKDRQDEANEDAEEDEELWEETDELGDRIDGLAFTDLIDTFGSYVGLGLQSLRIKSDETGLEPADPVGALLQYNTYALMIAAGVPTIKPILAQITGDGQKNGIWLFPADGGAAADWVQVWPWFLQAITTGAGGTGIDYEVAAPKIVYIPDGNAQAGVWLKPQDAADASDVVPLGAVIAFEDPA